MSNKEMTPEWLTFVRENLPTYSDKLKSAEADKKAEYGEGIAIYEEGWASDMFPEAMKAYTDSICRAQHEKSCRAQKEITNSALTAIVSVETWVYREMSAIPLADFNDTITE